MSSESSVDFLRCFVFVHGCTQLVDGDADFHKALSQVDFLPLSKINALKDFGNNLFRQHLFDFAGDCYGKACRLPCSTLNEKIDHDLQSSVILAVSLSLNLVACANKLFAFEGALSICSMVLNFFPHNAKALFSSSVAFRGLNRFTEAKCALEAARLIEPHNKDIIEELEEVKKSLVFNQNAQRVVVDCLDTSDVQQGEKLVSSPRIQEVDVFAKFCEWTPQVVHR
ncbi:uncharacterized protein LOC141622053 [Silene latifolia]|uniref:uncharacterized protein LOC141622053 n=1 Tax=Silene latifolia TaxID=37657 RepID=UPI003D770498